MLYGSLLCRSWPALVSAAAALSCSALQAPSKPFEFEILINSDPGIPVAGATLLHEGSVLGKTNAQGKLALAAQGSEGETLAVNVNCPEILLSPSSPVMIALRRLSDAKRRPQYKVMCPPRARTLVVAVRADNGPNLPVKRLGRDIARTDSSGAALVALEVAPDEAVDLTLDTAQSPWLKPKDPTQRFQAGDTDALVAFTQNFEGKPAARTGVRTHAGPIRIEAR